MVGVGKSEKVNEIHVKVGESVVLTWFCFREILW